MSCWNPLDITSCIASTAEGAASSAFDSIVQDMCDAMAKIFVFVTTWWVKIPTPAQNVDGSAVYKLWQNTGWLTTWIAVLCLLISAGRLAWSRRAEPAVEAAKGLLTYAIVCGASIAAIDVLTSAGDQFSSWVIETAAGSQDFATAISKIIVLSASSTELGPMLTLIIALIATIACLLQVVLMFVRNAMVVLLLGTLPMSAAASATTAGQAWFKKSLAWLIAFVLYKPVAALIYAASFYMMAQIQNPKGSTAEDMVNTISGVVMLVLSLVALPALMRFAVPMVSAAAGGGGAAAMMGGAIGMGAKKVADMGSKSGAGDGGGGGDEGASQPKGAKSAPDPKGAEQSSPSSPPPSSPPASSPPAGASPGGGGGGGVGASTGTTGAGAAGGTSAAASAAPPVAAALAVKQLADGAKKAADGAVSSTTGESA